MNELPLEWRKLVTPLYNINVRANMIFYPSDVCKAPNKTKLPPNVKIAIFFDFFFALNEKAGKFAI